MQNNWQNILKNTSLPKKIMAAGSLLMIVGVFLPWYTDMDRHNLGDTFLGISGPLYLAGIIVLGCGGAALLGTFLQATNRRIKNFPSEKISLYYGVSALAIFMMVLVNSVYFHPKFGVNLLDKTRGIGMILTAIGSLSLLIGTFQSTRVKESMQQKNYHNLEVANHERDRGRLTMEATPRQENIPANVAVEAVPERKISAPSITPPLQSNKRQEASMNADDLLKNYFNLKKKND